MNAPFLFETERLRFREIGPNDALGLFRLEQDPIVRRYVGVDKGFATVEDARAFAERYQDVYRKDGYARWAAIERGTEDFLGWCGLRKQPNGDVDLGYRYRPDTWGKGLATEAARECLRYGFDVLGLEEIVATAMPENVASLRVLEKVGFRFVHEADDHELPGMRLRHFVLTRPKAGTA